MGFGFSLFLIAVGAILTFAVHVTNPHGFDIHTIGVILMWVGFIGAILTAIFWAPWTTRREETYVESDHHHHDHF